jgi:EpsI family protein
MNKRRKFLAAAVLILGAQLAASLTLSRKEYLPSPPPLSEFPWTLGEWQRAEDQILEAGVLEMLAPDDFLHRLYLSPRYPAGVGLFMVYYKTQHRASNAHDPKVCLPGSGWNPLNSKVIDVPVPESGVTVPVNYYVIAKGPARALVLYWYQTHKRAFAREQGSRLQRILDTVAEQRTDIALVRVVVPILGPGPEAAEEAGIRFIQQSYPIIMRQFPPKDDLQ